MPRTNARKTTKSRHVKQPIATCTVEELLATFTSLQATKGRQQLKLGTKFIHIPTNHVFILRAITDPKTLKPTRYLWCKDTEQEHFDINPTEWKKA